MMSHSEDPMPEAIRLKDYRPPAFLIDTIDLVFELGEDGTRVASRLAIRRNPLSEERSAPLVLDGEAIELVSLALDGEGLGPNRYVQNGATLTLAEVPDAFLLDIETRIHPEANTELSGLYKSGGNFCTQCEPEGFRRITYFIDRPDVMARFSASIVADRKHYPILLSNGNPVDRGDSGQGRHWVKWVDPHPKPSYLFALVAGDLIAVQDEFTTRSGREVALGIWVRRGDEDKCGHAMKSLKAAMRWDEEVFGLEYDLDIYNIVAVSDFNMGAMENKGLNVFNTKYVLAKSETATDRDFQMIEGVIAHEYFHNWTGNRVTCRDWFQLSLKEGLTVFRDQEFSADQGSRAVRRIGDVRGLRAAQFPEDSGPLAHPVQPESYIRIDNFYTATVYNKGAEVVRMIHTLLGPEGFRRGMDLYFGRHDNQAVTIGDFVAAMQDASGVDLKRFALWYRQAGTPEIEIEDHYDPATGCYDLTVRQSLGAGPSEKSESQIEPQKYEPMVIPVAVGLIGADGVELPTRLEGEVRVKTGTRVLIVTQKEQHFRFVDVPSAPQPSLLRFFSAPVKLKGLSLDRLKFLANHDSEPFARWEASQQAATQVLLGMVAARQQGRALAFDPDLVEAWRRTLARADADPAFAAEALILPSESFLAEQLAVIDPESIHEVREFARARIGEALRAELLAAYERFSGTDPKSVDGEAIGHRALRNACLAYLTLGGQSGAGEDADIARVKAQYDAALNMTDTLAALSILADFDRPEQEAALASFYERWQAEDLVVDKWLGLHALSALPGTLERVRKLTAHKAFDIRNPNRVRALIGAFAHGNQFRFHAASGAAYVFLADRILELDPLNATTAARLVQPLCTWRRYDPRRQALMKHELERILGTPELSKNTYEMASKSLG